MRFLADIGIKQPAQNAGVKAPNVGQTDTYVQNVVQGGIQLIFVISAIAFLFMIAWASFNWITSGGDKENVAKAKSRITQAVIGLVILSLMFVISAALGNILEFNPMGKLTIPQLGK